MSDFGGSGFEGFDGWQHTEAPGDRRASGSPSQGPWIEPTPMKPLFRAMWILSAVLIVVLVLTIVV